MLIIWAVGTAGCNNNITITFPFTSGSSASATYSVGGIISGLSVGNTVSLQNNNSDTLTVTGGGSGSDSFTFSTNLVSGTTYNISVSSQPAGKTCTVGGNSGTIDSANVSSVKVICLFNAAVNVAINGTTPTNLQITNTTVGTQTLTFNALGNQVFATAAIGSSYSLSITTQPAGMTCGVTSANSSGFILAGGVLVTVNCVSNINADLTVSINTIGSIGTDVIIDYTITNNGVAAANNFSVDFWAARSTAVTNPLSSAPVANKSITYTSLAGGASVTGYIALTISVATYSGTAYALIDSTSVIGETNETNNVASYVWPANQTKTLTSLQSNFFIGSVAGFGTSTYTFPVTSGNNYNVTIAFGNSNGSPVFGSTTVTSGANNCAPLSIADNGSCTITAGAVTMTVSVTSSTVAGVSAFLLEVTPPFTFESGNLPAQFTNDPLGKNWYVTQNPAPANPNTTQRVFASSFILDSQTSCFSTVVNNVIASSVTFDYSVASEACCDFLQFFINGIQMTPATVGTWSSAVNGTPLPWTTSPVYGLAGGPNTLKWCYSKDASLSNGADKAWVDNILVY